MSETDPTLDPERAWKLADDGTPETYPALCPLGHTHWYKPAEPIDPSYCGFGYGGDDKATQWWQGLAFAVRNRRWRA